VRVVVAVCSNCWVWWELVGIGGGCLEFAGSYLELLGDAGNCWQRMGDC